MKKIRVAINGFGRIGKQVFRVLHEKYRDQVDLVAINDLGGIATGAHLLQYDSCYGRADFSVKVTGDKLIVDPWTISCCAEKDPNKLPWADFGVDVVIEATGIFKSGKEAAVHRSQGAKKVIVTAPTKEEDITIVMGVNHTSYDAAKHHVVSNASCTTNCLAPVALILHEEFGIESGVMCTIHSYTNDQRILDVGHSDLRRARAAACNIIPTSTGAAQAVAKVIPELAGKFSGYSLRVPTPTVSVVDFACTLKKDVSTEELRSALKKASETKLKGILGYSDLALVSSDFKKDPHSSILDAEYTEVVNKRLAKIVSWYDNEWGYSNRVADLLVYMGERGL